MTKRMIRKEMGFYEFMGVILVLGMILILLRGLVTSCRKKKWAVIQEQKTAAELTCADDEPAAEP